MWNRHPGQGGEWWNRHPGIRVSSICWCFHEIVHSVRVGMVWIALGWTRMRRAVGYAWCCDLPACEISTPYS